MEPAQASESGTPAQGRDQDREGLRLVADAMVSVNDNELQEALDRLDDGDWAQLQSMIGTREVRSVQAERGAGRAPQGDVIVLPGIMGTDLGVSDGVATPSHLWFDIAALASGGLAKLALPLDSTTSPWTIVPGGLLKLFYLPIQMRLRMRWRVHLFPYDWRLDIGELGRLLAHEVKATMHPNEPLHLVAHSMGGLVARAMIALEPDAWEGMSAKGRGAAGVGRLVMLGTPNHGSFAPVLTLTGKDVRLRALALLDQQLRMDDVLKVVATFPGLHQMMPFRGDTPLPELDWLYDSARWPTTDVHQSLLDGAEAFQKTLIDAVDADRMVYVGGYGHRTVDAAELRGRKVRWRRSRAGDGTVPCALGALAGVPSYWVTAKHGALPKHPSVLDALDDLLTTGRCASLLAADQPPEGRGADDVEWLDFDELVSDQAIDNLVTRARGNEIAVLDDVLPVFEGEREMTHLRLSIGVVWTDIGEAEGDVIAVGHYQDVYPTASEAALDIALSGDVPRQSRLLYGATVRGIVRGGLGDITTFPWRRGEHSTQVALVGLGRPGTFGLPQHVVALRNLLWTTEHVVHGQELTMVLIGAGAGNLSLEAAVRSLLEALDSSVRDGELAGTLKVIRIVEWELGRARRIHRVLGDAIADRSGSDPAADLSLSPLSEVGGAVSVETALERLLVASLRDHPDTVSASIGGVEPTEQVRQAIEERLRNMASSPFADGDLRVHRAPQHDSTEVPTRFTILVRDGELMVAAISDTATVAERMTGLEVELFQQLIEQANAEAGGDIDRAGKLLLDFAVPAEFRPFLASSPSIVVEVDPITAGLQWEILPAEPRGRGRTSALGLRTPLARQLRTTRSQPPSATLQTPLRRVLVIGDPGGPGGTGALPGARAEALAVVEILRQERLGITVDVLLGPEELKDGTHAASLRNVLHHLLHFEYDVVHYAGHGTFSAADPSLGSGWLLGERLLRGKHLTMAQRMPPLIVANACHSGRISTGLPGLADEFLGRGVRHIVGASRAVNDESARRFSEVFYRALVGTSERGSAAPATLGKAVLSARRELADHGRQDWDAYQLYGDPEFRFTLASASSGDMP